MSLAREIPYRVATYDTATYATVFPYPYLPELRVPRREPLTPERAQRAIGRTLEPLVGGYVIGDYYAPPLAGKESSSQESVLVVGHAASGKTLFIRVLCEALWLTGFTPIFAITRKNDFAKWERPNVADLRYFARDFADWLRHFVGEPITVGRRELEERFEEAFVRRRFRKRILYPAYVEDAPEEDKFRLNPRHLNAWQIQELFGFNIEAQYMRLYDRAFVSIWRKGGEGMTFGEFVEALRRYSEALGERSRVALLRVVEALEYSRELFQEDGRNSLVGAYREPTLVNLSFFGAPASRMAVAFIANFVSQVIEGMRLVSSAALVLDDVSYFIRDETGRANRTMTRVLDQVLNIEGRCVHSGLKRVIAVQSLKQLPRPLRDLKLYNKVVFARPRAGWLKSNLRQFECEVLDNDANVIYRVLLRPPVTSRP